MSLTVRSIFNIKNWGIFLFPILNIGFFFETYQSIINLSYVVLFLTSFYVITFKGFTIRHKGFCVLSLLFLLYSFASVVWAYNEKTAQDNAMLLAKCVFVTILYLQLLLDKKDVSLAMFSIAVATVIYGFIYLQTVDIARLGAERLMSQEQDLVGIANVNLVSLGISISFLYFGFMLFSTKKILYLVPLIAAAVIVFVLGSRKSILTLVLGALLLLLGLNKKNKATMTAIIIMGLLIVTAFIPQEYLDFIGTRFDSFLSVFGASHRNVIEGGDIERAKITSNYIPIIMRSPIVGSGYYNFGSLFALVNGGRGMYAHNNYVEVLADCGIIGFMIYYAIIYKTYKRLPFRQKQGIGYMYMSLLILFLFNFFFIVLTHDMYTWLMLGTIWVGSKMYLGDNNIATNQKTTQIIQTTI